MGDNQLLLPPEGGGVRYFCYRHADFILICWLVAFMSKVYVHILLTRVSTLSVF